MGLIDFKNFNFLINIDIIIYYKEIIPFNELSESSK